MTRGTTVTALVGLTVLVFIVIRLTFFRRMLMGVVSRGFVVVLAFSRVAMFRKLIRHGVHPSVKGGGAH